MPQTLENESKRDLSAWDALVVPKFSFLGLLVLIGAFRVIQDDVLFFCPPRAAESCKELTGKLLRWLEFLLADRFHEPGGCHLDHRGKVSLCRTHPILGSEGVFMIERDHGASQLAVNLL